MAGGAGQAGRRGFLRLAAAAAAGTVAAALARGRAAEIVPSPAPGGKGRGVVALARGPGVGAEPGGPVDVRLLSGWLGQMVVALTGAARASEAWGLLFHPADTVGLKLNCLSGPLLSPRRELVEALVQGLVAAGVRREKILVWDRSGRELARAGFRPGRGGEGPQVLGTDDPSGGYESEPRVHRSVGSCFSRLFTDRCTALVSVGVLKDHDLAGVSAGLKNLYGMIHNPNKYHDNGCDPYVADLAAQPLVRQRLRLTVCDGLTAQCQGGPAFVAGWAWNYGGLLAALDPVALDRVAAQVIERRRAEKGLPSLAEAGRPPAWIETAGRLGLGEADSRAIRLLEIG